MEMNSRFFSKKNVTLGVLCSFLLIILISVPLSPRVEAAAPPFTINSGWTTTSPVIDGQLDTTYISNSINMSWLFLTKSATSYVYFLNNDTHMFVFIDAVADTTGWLVAPVWIFLDTNNSKQLVLPPDAIFGMDLKEVNIVFYPTNLNFSHAVYYGGSVNSPTPHVQVEISLGLGNMTNSPKPGDTIGFLLAYGTDSDTNFDEYLPFNFYTGNGGPVSELDESTYAELTLATAPSGPTTPPFYFDPTTVIAVTVGVLIAVGITAGAAIPLTYYLTKSRVSLIKSRKIKF